MSWLSAVTVAAITLSVVSPATQWLHLRRAGSAEGLNFSALTVAPFIGLLWFCYGVAAEDLPLSLAYGMAAAVSTAVLIQAGRLSGRSTWRALGCLALLLAGMAAAAVVFGLVAVSVTTVVVTVARPALQLSTTLRSSLYRGISSRAFAIGMSSCLLWSVYGFGIDDPITAGISVWCGICYGVVAARAAYLRRRAEGAAADLTKFAPVAPLHA